MEQEKLFDSCNLQDPITYKISEKIALRIYPDTRPCCLEIASLHKGLVLIRDDKELIEEGAGFGVPIVRYKKTYFPGNATCRLDKSKHGFSITKIFNLNLISRKKIGKSTYLNDTLYKFFRKQFEIIYLRKDAADPLLNRFMEFRKYVGVETEFIKVKSKGIVKVTYHFVDKSINIDVDFAGLDKKDCQEILLLNEQGATFFSKYSDTSGLVLSKNKINGWKIVNSERAQMSDVNGKLKFILKQQAGVRLFRGREQTRNRFSWTGLSYSLNPSETKFNYTIKIES